MWKKQFLLQRARNYPRNHQETSGYTYCTLSLLYFNIVDNVSDSSNDKQPARWGSLYYIIVAFNTSGQSAKLVSYRRWSQLHFGYGVVTDYFPHRCTIAM